MDGLLLIDKPRGITSHDAIDAVRRALGVRKVGHAGTLDPMASGLLLVGVGKATRLLRFLGDLDKEYEGTGRLGEETDTLDADGVVTLRSQVDVSEEKLRAAMSRFVGAIRQRPPAYSAVKVGGRKLYRAARGGEVIEAPERSVRVEAFDLHALRAPDFDFRIVCSSGTYVRVLVADLGTTLGCGAHLTGLVRTRIGPFAVADATPPNEPGEPLPPERAVAHLPRVDVDEDEAEAAGHGRPLGPAGIEGPYGVFDPADRLIGIYRDEGAKARPEVVLAP
ncbi:MAG: tRNA pseudouridine(55) synthase TruB [Actinomycetota bacterium]